MPGHTPSARRKKPAEQEKKRRNKRQHGFARPRMEPAGRVVHAPESCPECHTTWVPGPARNSSELRGNQQSAAFQEGIEAPGPPSAKER